jgi:hypothetical protein
MGRALAGVLALVLLAPATLWAVVATVAATPCGLDGQGILRSTGTCQVEVHHVLSVVFGFGGVAFLTAGVLLLSTYAVWGSSRARRSAFRLLTGAAVLALIWIVAALG